MTPFQRRLAKVAKEAFEIAKAVGRSDLEAWWLVAERVNEYIKYSEKRKHGTSR